MAFSLNCQQFNNAFMPKRLGNWEVPALRDRNPIPRPPGFRTTAAASSAQHARLHLGEAALTEILSSGRLCKPKLLEEGIDADLAYENAQAEDGGGEDGGGPPARRGRLLFDFKSLPKPTFVPSQAEGGSAPMETDPPPAAAASGKKRKAAENGA